MWSWVLAVIGVAGIYFVGRKTIWGWIVLCFNEILWITYALITKQYGFIFSAIAYAAVYIKSFIHWRRDDAEVKVSAYEMNTHGSIDHRFIKVD